MARLHLPRTHAEFFFNGLVTNFQALNDVLLRKEVNRLTQVNLRPNESQDQLLRRFRKKVAKSGILSTVRRKRWFVSKSELRRIQKKKAIRRLKRRQQTDNE